MEERDEAAGRRKVEKEEEEVKVRRDVRIRICAQQGRNNSQEWVGKYKCVNEGM
jgi:hypothetical protein